MMKRAAASSEHRQSSDPPVIREAIDATLHTIERRTRLYRNLVISITILSIASILLSIIRLSWVPACGIVLIVPTVGVFLFLDGLQIRRWQAGLMEMWRHRNLNLKEFERTITSFRHVPPQSLNGMLSALPKDSSHFNRDHASEEEKTLWAEKIDALSRRQAWRTLTSTTALSLTLFSLIGAALFHYIPLLVFAAGFAILLIILKKK